MYNDGVKEAFERLRATANQTQLADIDFIEDMYFQDATQLKINRGEITHEQAHIAYAKKHNTDEYMPPRFKHLFVKE